MSYQELYINNSKVDLYDGEQIGLTLRAATIAEVGIIKSGFSNIFKVPTTKNNLKLLASPEQINNGSELPYQQFDARYNQNGVPIVQRGKAVIEEIEKDISLSVYSENFSIITYLGDKLLSDIPTSKFDSIDYNWNLTNVLNRLNTTTEVVHCLVNYGGIAQDGTEVNVTALPPCIYVKWLFDAIFEDAPFSVEGDLLDDPIFETLVIDINELVTRYFIDFYAGSGRLVTFTSDQTYTYFDIASNANGGTFLNIDGAYQTDGNGISFFEAPFAGTYRFRYSIDYTYNSSVSGREAFFDIGPAQVDDTDRIRTEIVINQREQLDGTIERILTMGERIYIRFTPNTATVGSDTVTIHSSSYYIDPISDNLRGRIQFSESVHDLKQSEFVGNLFQIFGVLPSYNEVTNVLSLNYLQNRLEKDAQAKDWSDKIDFSKAINIKSFVEGFAQNNILQWDNEDTEEYNSVITISDTKLPNEETYVELDFAASEMRIRLDYNINMPRVLKYTEDGGIFTQTRNTAPRMFYVVDGNNDSINFTDGTTTTARTAYKVAKFYQPSAAFNLSFRLDGNLIDRQYARLRDSVLVSAKTIRAYFKLNQVDIYNLELPEIVYINTVDERYTINGYFYINQIEDYVSGIPCLVELIRVL